MRLADLQPRWLNPYVFTFWCPHCRTTLLACKSVVMTHRAQRILFEKALGEEWNTQVVPMKEECAWKIQGTLPELTVQPSLDASASGHWHGHITAGEILGGVILEH